MRGAALIVLAWNHWPLTRRCLDSLLAGELDEARVIVVDNGSTDETPVALGAYGDRVRIIRLPENLGFVRGMQAGIKAAAPDDDVVLLNNDLVFTQPDWLARLRDAAYAAPEHGIVGCRLLTGGAQPRLGHVGGFIEPDELWGQQSETGRSERDIAQYDRLRRVQGIAFALAYIRRDCLDAIGGLDEVFHSYYEDTDYCLRAAEVGIATVVAGEVTLRHDQHGSTRDDAAFREHLRATSRETFAARWQERLRQAYRGEVLWQGVSRLPAAPAQLAVELVRRLDARGARMGFAPVAAEVPGQDDYRLELAMRRRLDPSPEVALVCAAGEHLGQARGRSRLGLSWTEWDGVPASWVQAADTLDLLLVPDAFQREAWLRAGAKVPVEVLPLGVDRNRCHVRVPAQRHPDGAFVFLAVIEELQRDAPETLVAAFMHAFGGNPEVELLLYVRPGPGAAEVMDTLELLVADCDNIRILANWAFPAYQRVELLAAADAYASVRRGAGWDPLAAEALACGKALVASDFGSQGELAREHGFAVAAGERVEDPRRPGLRWADPDPAALAIALRTVVRRRARLAAEAPARAAAFAAAHDIEASADRLFEHVARLGRFRPAAPRPVPHAPARLARPASGQVVVLGMHRSGTSAVAGLLARMGAWAGPEEDLLVGPDNPKGHYESGRLHMACLRRLEAAGGDWREPPDAAPAAAVDAFRREVAALLDGFEAHRPWFIKEPRLCLLARELLPLLTRPVFVLVVREPRAVARSLARRDGIAAREALALWERYNSEAFAASRGWPRVLVDYDALLADPQAAMRRLLDELRALGVTALHEPTPAELAAWIEPAAPRADGGGESELAPSQQALWDAIRDRSILDAAGSAEA